MQLTLSWLRLAATGLIRYLLALGLFVVVWHLASVWVGKPNTLPRPTEVLVQAIDLIATGELFGHVVHTLRRLMAGFALAFAVGVPLGMALGLSRTLADYVTPVVETLRPISGIAWIPLALYALGVGEALPHFIIFYGAVFPILVNAAGAVRQVDPGLINAARTLGASRFRVTLSIVLPACLPMIFVGARLGLGVGWMAVIASELVGAPSGLGYMIEWNRTMLMSSRVLVGVLTIGFLGYLMDWSLRRAARALTPWWMGWRQQHG